MALPKWDKPKLGADTKSCLGTFSRLAFNVVSKFEVGTRFTIRIAPRDLHRDSLRRVPPQRGYLLREKNT